VTSEPVLSPRPLARRPGRIELEWRSPQSAFVARHERKLVALLLLIGLVLRCVPLLWGSTYYNPAQSGFHPDEPKLVRWMDDLPGSFTANTDYRYPPLLPIAYGALWLPVRAAMGIDSSGRSTVGEESYEAAQLFGRALNVLVFGLGGLLLIWSFTRRRYGAGAGVLALASASTMGLPVTSTALMLPDIGAAVLLFAVFVQLARLEARSRIDLRGVLVAGVLLGAASATKYTSAVGVMGILALLGSEVHRRRLSPLQGLRLAAAAGTGAVLVFLLFVPGVWLKFEAFSDSLAYEYRNKLVTSKLDLASLPDTFRESFPWPLMAAAALGVACAWRWRREPAQGRSVVMLSAAATLAIYFLVSLRSFRPDYALPFFPFVAVFAGVGLWQLVRLPAWRVGSLAVVAGLTLGVAQSSRWVSMRYSADTRYAFEEWVTEHIPQGAIGLAPAPTFRSSGASAPAGYHYVGVNTFPEYLVIFQRRADQVREFLDDPEALKQKTARIWGPERAASEIVSLPGRRRLGGLDETDLQFYEDVLLGQRRRWRYDLVKEVTPSDAPLDLPGRRVWIYRNSGTTRGGLPEKQGP
jgi:4-amino-4-deoxy-L-arabinose transferase-like glycosyltransferase